MDWIDRKERLPEQSGEVLVWIGDTWGVGVTQVAVSCYYAETGRFGVDSDFQAVTHWMPLPVGPNR
jgi:hypothetical protein